MKKIHNLTKSQSQLINWNPGDYTLHNYGRGKIEVGVITATGRIFGVADEDVPAFVNAKINFLFPDLYQGINECVAEKVRNEW